MFDRAQIEKLLRINGIDVSSPDEEIKSVLISARWHEDDVDTALLVLRENKESHDTHVDSLHKVFNTDDRLKPETISALLGIDMKVSEEDVTLRRRRARGQLTPDLLFNMTLVSLGLSVVFVISSMWYLEMGIFHQSLH